MTYQTLRIGNANKNFWGGKTYKRKGRLRPRESGSRISISAATARWFEMRGVGGRAFGSARSAARAQKASGRVGGVRTSEREMALSAWTSSGTGPRGAGAERNGQTALSTHYEKKEGSGGRAEKRGKTCSERGTRTGRKSDGVTFASRSHASFPDLLILRYASSRSCLASRLSGNKRKGRLRPRESGSRISISAATARWFEMRGVGGRAFGSARSAARAQKVGTNHGRPGRGSCVRQRAKGFRARRRALGRGHGELGRSATGKPHYPPRVTTHPRWFARSAKRHPTPEAERRARE
ncbi:hypothetical protein C8R47DRAFT_1067778 [Mycena vitilis]|nr:hypothetical protein C8R47DRAFT_1067778 [Mycena vitilis]